MDIVERVVRLNDAISQVERQASALRHDIMRMGTGLAGPACDSSPQRDDGPQRYRPIGMAPNWMVRSGVTRRACSRPTCCHPKS